MEPISSRDNQQVKRAVHLAQNAGARAEEGLFFAEGLRLCQDLAQSAAPESVFITQPLLDKHPEVAAWTQHCYVVNDGVAQKLGDTKTPQGLFCLFPLPRVTFEELRLADGVLLCEDVQDPANVGTMVRSAAGLGYGGVVLAGASADAFGTKALRASMGAVLRLPVWRCPSAESAAEALKNSGLRLYAATLAGAMPLAETRFAPPFAVLIGNEGTGLSQQLLAQADERVYIPMHNGVESLNAAAAAAVMLHQAKAGR